MRVVVTGGTGFLGWHTRLRLDALTSHEVTTIDRNNWGDLVDFLAGADALIHLAGINRAKDEEDVERDNIRLGDDVAAAIAASNRPLRVVMAGTIQAHLDNPYGRGKRAAQMTIEKATKATGGQFVDVCLPNLFGEHGRPHYNSFVATFIDAVISGKAPVIRENVVELLHSQDAAQALIDGLNSPVPRIRPAGLETSVTAVWDLLNEFHSAYFPSGEIPVLNSKFRINLFNSYRAALFPSHTPIPLTPHTDARGTFVETVRCRGGEGQSSFSTTVPGVTRGDHYHLTKIERFAVVQGAARISLRKKFSNTVFDFNVAGDKPEAIDMPIGWVHNITNVGSDLLVTQFWSHEIFRPEDPDTYAEPVRGSTQEDPK